MKVHKKNKLLYYIESYFKYNLPSGNAEKKIKELSSKFSADELEKIKQRVDYYNKLSRPEKISGKYTIEDLRKPQTPKAYYFDTYKYALFFDKNLSLDFLFGDVKTIPETPSIVKSRPIAGNNKNSVLLKLDRQRHFKFIEGDKDFLSKNNILFGRASVYQPHRYDFFEKYFHHPMCDLGQVNKREGNPAWLKPKVSIQEHLDYKFILSLEGTDVGTNLKWIMSSNSIAVMPKPTYETWFMEGTLEGGRHYIEINKDYSDLEEKLNYYIAHSQECLQIIDNAHKHCRQFFNKEKEDLCSLLVLDKYFKLT